MAPTSGPMRVTRSAGHGGPVASSSGAPFSGGTMTRNTPLPGAADLGDDVLAGLTESGRRADRTGHGGRVLDLLGRRPLTCFFVLSCLLSWWPAVLYGMGKSPTLVAGFGPFLAAVLVLGATQGRAGIRGLLRSMVTWRVPARAYVLAVGLPLTFSGGAVVVNLALGAADPSPGDLAAWTGVPVTALLLLVIPGIGGAWEEPGFRGFALPRLEQRLGAATGPVVLGGLWVLWHAPLFAAGQILWTDVFTIVAASVVIAAVFHIARESVLVAMILHATNNAVGGNYASELFDGADKTRLGIVTALAWSLAAATVLLRIRRASRRYAVPTERLAGTTRASARR